MRPNIFPVLRYDDAVGALQFLHRAFGFDKHSEHLGPGGTVAHAEMKTGASTVGVSSVTPPTPANPWSAVRQGIYVCVNDIDALYARATQSGIEIATPIRDMDYGSRDFAARDRGGYLWGFATYDMAAGDAEPTMFPEVHYRDARVAIAELTSAFGFETTLAVPGPNGTVMHAELTFGDGVVMSGEIHDDPSWGDGHQCICVYQPDPDAHYARAKEAGAAIVKAPETTPFGARHYAARDPAGFLWLFSTCKPSRR